MSTEKIGIIIVDHGSRRPQSNDMLLDVVQTFRQRGSYAIVEPAHMELAEPTIQTAFDRCVEQGATRIVVHPYFLLPGRHWDEDIPNLAAAAAVTHPGITYLVTAPVGLHPLMAQVIDERIQRCLAHAQGQSDACPACAGTEKCQFSL